MFTVKTLKLLQVSVFLKVLKGLSVKFHKTYIRSYTIALPIKYIIST